MNILNNVHNIVVQKLTETQKIKQIIKLRKISHLYIAQNILIDIIIDSKRMLAWLK